MLLNAFWDIQKIKYRHQLRRLLGFRVKNVALYKQSFRHKAIVPNATLKSNERLEFLGDAVLSGIVSHYLYEQYADKNEGFLSEIKAKIVSRKSLNNLATSLELNTFISLHENNTLQKNIFGNCLEALIGAVFIDRGYVYAKKFVLEKIIAQHINLTKLILTETNFKSRVMEWSQKEKKSLAFEIKETGSAIKNYTATLKINKKIVGVGQGVTKKEAEQLAAKVFYKTLSSSTNVCQKATL